jgi:hypothetical protein
MRPHRFMVCACEHAQFDQACCIDLTRKPLQDGTNDLFHCTFSRRPEFVLKRRELTQPVCLVSALEVDIHVRQVRLHSIDNTRVERVNAGAVGCRAFRLIRSAASQHKHNPVRILTVPSAALVLPSLLGNGDAGTQL